MGEALLAAVLIGGASYRLWRFAAVDDATAWVLRPVRDRWSVVEGSVSCAWCLGTLLTWGIVWVTDATVGLDAPLLVALAAAVVCGVLGDRV